jgi:ParB family chromosome partitioning protein
VDIREGLVKRQTHASVSGATAATAEKVKGARAEYSKSLLRYMTVRKTLAVQSAMLKNERVAKQVAIVQLMTTSSFKSSIRGEVHTAHQGGNEKATNAPVFTAGTYCTLLGLAPRSKWNRYVPAIDALMRENRRPVALYGKLKQLSDTALDELLLLLTTICFGQSDVETVDRSDSLFNHVAQDLSVDMAQSWRPDEAFLSGRTTDQLVQLARDSGATEVIGDTKGWKKKDLVTALARYFQRTDREGAVSWLPDAMHFNITEAPEPEEAEDDADMDDEAFDADADEADDDMADAA